MRQLETQTGAERGTTVASTRTRLTWRKTFFLFCSIGALVASFAFAGGASAMRETAATAPSIVSDQADYTPGSTVTLTGANWGGGEAVHIVVNDDQSEPWSYGTDVNADATGGFTVHFQLPTSFAATYSVQATGASGAVATTSFTDGNVSYSPARIPAAGFQSVTAGTSFNFAETLDKQGGGADPQVALPISVTNPTQSNQAACGGAQQTIPTSWISIVTPSLPRTISGPTSFTFRVTPATGSSGLYTGFVSLDTPVGGNAGSIALCISVPTISATTLSVAPATGTYGGTVNLLATLTSGGSGVSGKTISFSLNGSPKGTATTNASGVATLSDASLSGINAGTYTSGVSASFPGDSSFSESSGTASLTVDKANQTISFAAPSGVTFGDADSDLGATASSGLPVGYVSSTTGKCTIVGGKLHVVGAGDCTITASQGGNDNYNAATPVERTFAIAKKGLTVTAKDSQKIYLAPNPGFEAMYSGFVNGDGASSLDGTLTFDTAATASSPVGSYDVTPGGLTATNYMITFVKGTLKIVYASGSCLGSPGHAILQPINAGGDSVFKQGSTVPAKFRVCDANGNSIGTAGVVSSFTLASTKAGTLTVVDEEIFSTTPDTAFRWSASDQQWIFNISTKTQKANTTYIYKITLNDGSSIDFQYGLK
jgi:hypothetical protein